MELRKRTHGNSRLKHHSIKFPSQELGVGSIQPSSGLWESPLPGAGWDAQHQEGLGTPPPSFAAVINHSRCLNIYAFFPACLDSAARH